MTGRAVYACGYSGRQPEDVLAVADRLGAVLWDIRYSARSRRAEWSGTRPSALLGDRYRHMPSFGNLAYRTGGPVQLADPEAGLAAFDAESRDIVLLCQCARSQDCHRRVVAAYLAKHRGVLAVEIDWREIDRPAEIDQPDRDRSSRPRQMELGEPDATTTGSQITEA